MEMSKLTPEQALKMWIIANGVTVKEFAEKMGITYANALYLTSGAATMTYELLGRMAVAYGVQAIKGIARLMPKIEICK
jgi:transcriptional regulator with XRE-family HTH domain